ncbi:MAG: Lrp/AsnC ligand binding domain-containing protein, partial [Chloroflexota bacterium]
PSAFGFGVHTFIGIQADLTHAPDIAAQLAGLPEVLGVYQTTGGYDVLVELALPSNDAMLSFLANQLGKIQGVRHSEVYHVMRVFKRARDWRLPEQPANKASKVLVVDDDARFVRATRAILTRSGYEVVCAPGCGDGLRRVEEERPDLILLVCTAGSLGEVSKVTCMLKEHRDLRSIPILLVNEVEQDRPWRRGKTEASGLAVDSWMDKPVEADALLGEVARLLAK